MSYQNKLLLCIGNSDTQADQLSREIAQARGLDYHGIMRSNTLLIPGCWHTSVYDLKLTEVKKKLSSYPNCEILVLDQPASAHLRYREYTDTIDMAQELARFYPTTFVNQKMSNPFRQILDQNKSFCIAPFNSLQISNQGIRHCCWQSDAFTEYDDFYQDQRSQNMRKLMVAGTMIPQCEKCYQKEEVGAISSRQDRTLRWIYEMGYTSISDVVDNLKPINYEVYLGNKCNAMCRMCKPVSSHLIDREYKQIQLIDHSLGTIQLQNLNTIDLHNIKRLEVSGGESTISEEFEKFLEMCISQQRTDFEIFVSTNAYALSNKFLKLIKHFKNIRFSISIDGFQDVNLYVRWPIKWQKFCRNIELFANNLPPEHISFNTTVSIYNISRLYELYEFLDLRYPNIHCSMSFLNNPIDQVPWNFPDKQKVLDGLDQITNLTRYHKDEIFKSTIDGLITKISTCSVDLSMLRRFFEFNDKLDQSRGVKLKDFIPELEQCRNYM
jgi:hypothetical protein